MRHCLLLITAVLFLVVSNQSANGLTDSESAVDNGNTEALVLVVMDPLCDKLACDCVQGYAQRKYEYLGEFLAEKLEREVKVFWGDSIQAALEETELKPDIIVGKHSVITSAADELSLKLDAVAQLTGADGSVTQTGLIVVRKNDPAQTVADLKDYRIFFGPKDCDEKYKAPMKLLRENGISIPAKLEISDACSQAATKLMETDESIAAAAVISSYAEPLLAGCGTIEKGDLRIIGVSDEVEFVTAFVNKKLGESTRKQITEGLLATVEDSELLGYLETKDGFVPFSPVEGDSVEDDSAAGQTKQQLVESKKK